jgi:hypothetical protein
MGLRGRQRVERRSKREGLAHHGLPVCDIAGGDGEGTGVSAPWL